MPSNSAKIGDPVAGELAEIKRLLVFALLRSGASQGEVATALGVNQATVSRMFPGGVSAAVSRSGKKRSGTRG